MKEKKSNHIGRNILLGILVIVIIIAALPFAYDIIGGLSDYDKAAKYASMDTGRIIKADDAGLISYTVDKPAVYGFLEKNDLSGIIGEYTKELPYCSENTIAIKKLGYSLENGLLKISVKARIFGIIPVPIHAEAKVHLSGDELELNLLELKYGKWISIPVDEIVNYLGMDELPETIVLDISEIKESLCITDLSIGENALNIKSNIIPEYVETMRKDDSSPAGLAALFCDADSAAADALCGNFKALPKAVTDSESLSQIFSDMIKFASEQTAERMIAELEAFPFLNIEIDDNASGGKYTEIISDKLQEYMNILTGIRDNYKEINYIISANRFCNADGTAAVSELPESMETEIVLQYNQDYASIVKVNDGVYSAPMKKWRILPNPKISQFRCVNGSSLPRASGVSVFDLTLAFRAENGTPVIVFLTPSDGFGINIISEELFTEIKQSKTIPVYCSSDIISENCSSFNLPSDSEIITTLYY